MNIVAEILHLLSHLFNYSSTTCFCAFQRERFRRLPRSTLRPPLLSRHRGTSHTTYTSSSSSASARFLDTRSRMHAWTSNGDAALPNDGRAGHYRWRSDVLLVVRVAGKCCVARLALALSPYAHFTPYISASIINAKCASENQWSRSREGTIIRTRISPIPPAYASLPSESFISVYDSFTRSLCGLSYWIYSYCHIGYTLLRPTTRASSPLQTTDREIEILVSIYIHYTTSYVLARISSSVIKIDARSRNAWLRPYVARRRAYRSRSAAILLFVVFATLRERVYGAETYLCSNIKPI